MAIYNSSPNLQTYISAPYTLPVQQIVQAVDTRNRFWDAGASQLKNAYQTYLNLDLTHKSNKDNLNVLMQDVNKNLKKAVQSDLSIATNIGEAMTVFDPIVSGKTETSQNILGDNAITKHYKTQMQVAESFRTKDNGKEYSDINVSYMMQGLDKFSKDDPSKWRDHYSTRRMYTPYYDTSAEVRDLMKNFKPNITSSTTPDVDPTTGKYKSFYLLSKTDKSAYEKQLNAYLGANLSDKAKSQLAINGSVSYYNNPTVLAKDYSEYNNARIQGIRNDIEGLRGIVKGSSNQKLIDASNRNISELQNSLEDLIKEDTNLKAGNSEFFNKNIDRIAGSIYTDKYIKNLAKANEHIDVDVSYKPDQAALKWFGEDQENKRFNTNLDFQAEEHRLDRELRLKIATLKAGKGEPQFKPYTGTSDESDNKTVNIDYLDSQRKIAENLKTDAAQRLSEEIESLTGQKLSSLPTTERDKLVEQWLHENKGRNPAADDYYKKFNIANNIEKVYDDLDQYATSEVKRLHPELFEGEKYKPIENLNLRTTRGQIINVNIPASKVGEFLSNAKETPVKDKGEVVGYDQTIQYNGKTYQLDLPSFNRLYQYGLQNEKSGGNNIQYYKNKILDKSITAIKEEKLPIGDQEKIPAYTNLRDDFRRFGVKDEAVKSIRIFSTERGGVNFVIPPALGKDELGVNPKTLETNIEAMGGRKKTVDGSPVYFVPYEKLSWSPVTYSDPELNPIVDYFNYKKQVAVNSGKINTTIDAPPTVVYDPNNTGENIRLKMDLNAGVPEFFIVYDKKKIYDLSTGRGFGSLEQAAAYIKEYIKTKQDLQERIKSF